MPRLLFLLGFSLAVALGATPWKVETVDRSGVGKYATLKLDKDGNAHLAYVVDDGNRYPLKYAFWDHGLQRWFVMTVAEGASFPSLALDSRQHPRISWADYGTMSGSKLRYAHWDGASWQQQAIPLDSDVIGYYTSIALDAADNPSISFYEYRGARESDFHIRLRNVMWNGQAWEVRTVDGQEGSGKFNAMVAGPDGRFNLAYANVSASSISVRYAHWDGTTWTPELVEGLAETHGQGVGYSVNIAIDKEGDPHLVYVNVSTPQVRYAVRKKGRWQVDVVETISRGGYPDRYSIALDDDGTPYVSYYDAGRGVLRVAHRENQKWVAETVDTHFAGFTSSLQISGGVLWVAYADESGRGIKVARMELRESAAPGASQAGVQTSEDQKAP